MRDIKAYKAAYYQANKKRYIAQVTAYARAHPLDVRCKNIRRRLRIKQAAMDVYGGECAYCGLRELACLSIDHIKNNGAEERKHRVSGHGFYSHLSKLPRRTDLQVLCMNCQWRRREYEKWLSM